MDKEKKKDRQIMQTTLRFTADIHRKVKIACYENNITMQTFVIGLIKEYFDKVKK